MSDSSATDVPSKPDPAVGVARLVDIGVLELSGQDCVTFLQGYLTSDTLALEMAHWQRGAFCNLKGRVVATLWCRRSGERSIELLLHASLRETVMAYLAPYLRFARSELTDVSAERSVLASRGCGFDGGYDLPGTDDVPRQLGAVDPANAGSIVDAHGVIDKESWFAHALLQGDVVLTEQTSGRYLPQSLGLEQHRYIDFDKGCYLGQEVVARAQHRGRVKQQPVLLRIERGDGIDLPDTEVPLTASDGTTAELVQQAFAEGGSGLALAVTRSPETGSYSQAGITYRLLRR